MEKLSRVEKHKHQKRYSTDEIGDEISSEQLRKFQERLNRIDSDNFEAPKEMPSRAADYDPIHARRVEEPEKEETEQDDDYDESIPDDSDFDLHFNDALKPKDDNELTNDYLSRYINEVKQYNIDQGNAATGNTQLNILKGLEKDQKKAPETPYLSRRKKETPSFEKKQKAARTTEVPFINSRVTPASRRPQDMEEEDERNVEDIASEVQNLASDNNDDYTEPERRTSHMNTDEFTRQLEMERTTNQKLLDQTTQMQARMDDVGENLNDVSNKMRHTNQILNIVLIVVIVALIIVFGILIYWIVLAGGAQ